MEVIQTWKACDLNELVNCASLFVEFLKKQKLKFIALYGEMGAGKTTFTNAILKVMGVDEDGASPTFGIISNYQSEKEGLIYHCDFYRLKSVNEVLDIGFEDMLLENAWIFAEWPEKLGNLLPDKFVKVEINDNGGCREIKVSV